MTCRNEKARFRYSDIGKFLYDFDFQLDEKIVKFGIEVFDSQNKFACKNNLKNLRYEDLRDLGSISI